MILKHVGWSFVVFGSILMSNFWRVHCTQVSDSGPHGPLVWLCCHRGHSVSQTHLDFFLGSWGMNRSKGQTNRVNCKVAPIHSPWTQKKGTHSLYLQCFYQRSFLKFSEKSYKFKFLLFTDTLNLIWWNHCVCDLANRPTTLWLCSSGIEWKIFAWFNEGNKIPL